MIKTAKFSIFEVPIKTNEIGEFFKISRYMGKYIAKEKGTKLRFLIKNHGQVYERNERGEASFVS